jgi:E3 ubiquitin-protein ligase RNF115/126
MESTNSSRPVPATQEVVEHLPQEVLSANSTYISIRFSGPTSSLLGPLLTKDCAVCKDQFQLETEDPEQQVVVTLPCKHPFHKDCILPWLKSSGTCPVCRYALVPQPGQQTPPNTNSNTPSSSTSPRPSNNPTRARSLSPGGLGYQPRPISPSVPGLGGLASLFGVGNPRRYHRPSSSVSRTSPAQPSSPREQTSSAPGSRPRSDQSRSQQDRQPRFPGQWTDDMSELD